MAGVGGQGTILASNILANTGLELGYDVKTAEVHGMAQRGGTVESHIRWGEKVYSPLVEQGMADYLVGFETLEAARWPTYLKKDATVLINDFRIPPPLVNLGKAQYPSEQDVQAILEGGGGKVRWLKATGIALLVAAVALGGAHGCGVTARDILRAALGHGATGFVLVHNHPSGEPTPSAEDVSMTRAVARAADVIGVPLVDHVIVTAAGEWASLLEAGVL